MTEKEICMLLDHESRRDLRNACERGYINRVHLKQWGVKLLEGIEVTNKNGGRYLLLNIWMSIVVGFWNWQLHLSNLWDFIKWIMTRTG